MYYKELDTWQFAMALADEVYDLTEDFPRTERYGLTAQMRRAAVSVVSNIAEGQGRLTPGEERKHLGDARGSLWELDTQLELSRRRGFVDEQTARKVGSHINRVGRLITGLIRNAIRRERDPEQSYTKYVD